MKPLILTNKFIQDSQDSHNLRIVNKKSYIVNPENPVNPVPIKIDESSNERIPVLRIQSN